MTAFLAARLPGVSDTRGAEALRRPALAGYPAATSDRMSQRQYRLELLPSAGAAGEQARRFIEARYREFFGSNVGVRYPRLLVLSDGAGHVAAAGGIRRAAESSLFLEQYLDKPVEQAIAALSGRPVARHGLVELGSLAAVSSRAAMYLIAAMAAFMKQQGFDYALVTSTDRLRRLFGHFDFALRCLGDARKDALADGGDGWGHYYDHAPRVLAGSVAQCFAAVVQGRDRQGNAGRTRTVDDLIAQAQALAAW